MSEREALRYAVVDRVLQGAMTQAVAAAHLGLSVRQVKRLCAAVRQHGAQGLVSRRRGVASNRRTAPARKSAIMRIVHERYADFGPQLASEYLRDAHAETVSAETLRGWMIEAGLWQARRRRAKRQHCSRQRRACFGELVQIDGSHHDWFEGRSGKCCLIAFIDDATGQVLAARFSATESMQAYFTVLHEHVRTHGAPLAYYSDRHSIFTKHDREDPNPTQFERALLQLGIESICAHSPQAKGRVERLFQTLQDRLCKAMRVAGIDNMEQANAWLPQYVAGHNRRFAVPAREQHDAHRPWTGNAQALARICSAHYQRQLSHALTCSFEGSQIWVTPEQTHAPKGRARVDIAQYADGQIEVLYRGQVLQYKAHLLHEHLRNRQTEDSKTVNDRVDTAARRQVARTCAQVALQEDMRKEGIQHPDTHISPPPARSRYGLGPSRERATPT